MPKSSSSEAPAAETSETPVPAVDPADDPQKKALDTVLRAAKEAEDAVVNATKSLGH
jgi:hypothetical protein